MLYLFGISTSIYAQSSHPNSLHVIDSIHQVFQKETDAIDSINQLAWHWRFEHSNQALELLNYSIDYSRKKNYKDGLLDGTYNKAVVLNKQLRVYEAKSMCEENIQLAKSSNNQKKLANAYSMYGTIFQEINIDSVFFYLDKSLEVYKKTNDTVNITSCLNQIALSYQKIKQDSLSIKYFEQIIYLASQIDYKPAIAGTYNNMGNSYIHLKDYKSAHACYQNALKVKREMQDTYGIAGTLLNIGLVYTKEGKYSDANTTLEQALKLFQSLEIPAKEAQVLINISNNYNQMGDYQVGLNYVKRAQDLLKESGVLSLRHLEIPIQEQLYEAYKNLGDYEKALTAFEQLTTYQQEEVNTDYNEKLSKNQALFESKLQNERIKSLNIENELNKQEIRKSVIQRNFLIASIASVLVITLLLFIGYRRKKKTQTILAEKNTLLEINVSEKKHLLDEIHHRVKNNLQMIAAFLEMQLFKSNNKELQNALNESLGRVRAMALIHKSTELNENAELISSKSYMENLLGQLTETQLETTGITIAYNIDQFELKSDQAISLGLIVNELVTNAFKYAFLERSRGEIEVNLSKTNSTICLTIADNGSGFDNQAEKGTGLRLVNAFVKKMNGTLDCTTERGTQYIIHLPLDL